MPQRGRAAGASRISRSADPHPSNNDFAATFACDLALKDMLPAVAAADETGSDLQVGRLSTSGYQASADAGAGNLNCSAVVEVTDGSIDSKERN